MALCTVGLGWVYLSVCCARALAKGCMGLFLVARRSKTKQRKSNARSDKAKQRLKLRCNAHLLLGCYRRTRVVCCVYSIYSSLPSYTFQIAYFIFFSARNYDHGNVVDTLSDLIGARA